MKSAVLGHAEQFANNIRPFLRQHLSLTQRHIRTALRGLGC
jgi:hypothetical protein